MPSFEDRLKKQFGDSLPEGEKLYTKENLNAIEQLKDLYSEDLNFILHQIILLDLKARLTRRGQKRLEDFLKRIDKDDYHNDLFFLNFSKVVQEGLSLFLFAAMGKIENLTGTSGHTKLIDPDLHKEYLQLNPDLKTFFERSCKAEKAREDSKKRRLNEILKDGYVTLREPYGRPEKVSLEDPRAVAFLETLTPSEKGADN